MRSRPPTRILLAGATGTLGRALIPALHARGIDVVALVRPGGEAALEPLGDRIRQVVAGEVTTPGIPSAAFAGVETVLSAVGITRQRDGLTYDQVDFAGNLNLLRAAAAAGVRRFAYVSVVGADRDVDVPVMRAKRRFEEALIGSALEWQIFRPSGFFTDLVDLLEMARRGTVHLFGDGRHAISPIHPEDLAEAIADLLAAEPARIVSIGGPADYTWNEVAELAYGVAGGGCRIRHWPEWLLRATLAVTRVLSRRVHGTLSFLGHVMTNDTTAPHHGSRGLESFFREQP